MSRNDDGETAREYIEPERERWSGLYNKDGQKLFREQPTIGFDPHRWDSRKGKRKGK